MMMRDNENSPSDVTVGSWHSTRKLGPYVNLSCVIDSLLLALDQHRGWSLIRLGEMWAVGRLEQDQIAPILPELGKPKFNRDEVWVYLENRVHKDSIIPLRKAAIRALYEVDYAGRYYYRPNAWSNVQGRRVPNHMDWGKWLDLFLDRYNVKLPETVWPFINAHIGFWRRFVDRVLGEEKLLLIGHPMQRWLQDYLQPMGLGVGGEYYEGKTTIVHVSDLLPIYEAIEKSEAAVVLVSLGLWAGPVVGYTKQQGKVVIDWGHVPSSQLEGTLPLNICCGRGVAGTAQHYKHVYPNWLQPRTSLEHRGLI